ncbi:helix-turn-helix domain-containing protein [Cellulosilyticum sp. I15G10I2]|uniref:helix-turn-helix domain-containing protein n=1 Tax=Cellulosilyticum sp. I15G10I2 TaxID=1892843 RepID=UPI00085C2974|nr:helix-turn-helix transcriptional regulator [Cellulosilyticum sp. I15G10I2]
MSTSSLIKKLCKEKGISVSELARRLGQSPQNFNKKLKRETVTTEELMAIGNELAVKFEQSYTLETGEKISISNVSEK